MFLDHKTLYYDVDPFLFYIVCECDDQARPVSLSSLLFSSLLFSSLLSVSVSLSLRACMRVCVCVCASFIPIKEGILLRGIYIQCKECEAAPKQSAVGPRRV